MNQQRITKQFVESKPFPMSGQVLYRDADLKGFGLRVTSGKKSYFAEAKVRGKAVRVTIGAHGVFTAEEARRHAKEYLAQMAQGLNPNELKRIHRADKESESKLQSLTLERVFQDYRRSRNLKAQTVADYEKVLYRCCRDWMPKLISAITKDMIESRHRKLSEHPAQANLAMRILRALFTYANFSYEGPDGRPLIVDNPVRRLSQVRAWNRIKRRESLIKRHQLKGWYDAVMGLDNPVMRDYLRLCLFTGLRRQEAAGLRWENVDLEARTLTVRDTKNYENHTLPLSDFLHEMLQKRLASRKNKNAFVFPGDGSKGHLIEPKNAISSVAKASGVHFMIHDLRRTFLTVAEGLDIPHYALKRLANHKNGTDVTAGYISADVERLRVPMQRITDFIKEHAGLVNADGSQAIDNDTSNDVTVR